MQILFTYLLASKLSSALKIKSKFLKNSRENFSDLIFSWKDVSEIPELGPINLSIVSFALKLLLNPT